MSRDTCKVACSCSELDSQPEKELEDSAAAALAYMRDTLIDRAVEVFFPSRD
jgi:hypothetical protein